MKDRKIEVVLTPDTDPELGGGQEYCAVLLEWTEGGWVNTGIVRRANNVFDAFASVYLASFE